MRNILISGGAGYIGSHMVKLLHANGFHTVVLDNLSNGHKDAVLTGEFVEGDIGDKKLVAELCKKYVFEGVINFASSILVGESMEKPAAYYENNVSKTLDFLSTLLEFNLKYFIFSSTAAIFGEPEYSPIDEKHPKQPLNVYGHTKKIIEDVLHNYADIHGFKFGTLRYFNAAGADPSGELGERHNPETHLIPLILQAAGGQRESIKLYGDDYKTHDGSCVRDYIHVNDLCTAHLKLVEYILKGGSEREFNLGTGRGYSVKEIISKVEEVVGCKIKVEKFPRRAGDAAILVADGRKAEKLLGWQAERSDIGTIIKDAWGRELKLAGKK